MSRPQGRTSKRALLSEDLLFRLPEKGIQCSVNEKPA